MPVNYGFKRQSQNCLNVECLLRNSHRMCGYGPKMYGQKPLSRRYSSVAPPSPGEESEAELPELDFLSFLPKRK